MRFFLIDRITEWEPGRSASAVKNISLSEDFFQDHFPRKPIMPGALILEGMAQLAGTLLQAGVALESGREVLAVMSIVERLKLRAPIVPGQSLTYRAIVEAVNEVGGRASVEATVGTVPVADCRITFVFHDVDDPWALAKRRQILALWLAGVGDG